MESKEINVIEDLKKEEKEHIKNLEVIIKRVPQDTNDYKFLSDLIEKRKKEWTTTYLSEWTDDEEIYKEPEEVTVTKHEEEPVKKEAEISFGTIQGKYINLVTRFNNSMTNGMDYNELYVYLNDFSELKNLYNSNGNIITNPEHYIKNIDKAIAIINQKLEQLNMGGGR